MNRGKKVKTVKTLALAIAGYLITIEQVFAEGPGGGNGLPCEDCPTTPVPEIDGSGAVLAIGLVVGLVALFREKFR